MARPSVHSEDYSITHPIQYEMGQRAANGVLDKDPGVAQVNFEVADTMWSDAPPHADPVLMAILAGYRDTMREHAERGTDA
jgi:hypothetical protein